MVYTNSYGWVKKDSKIRPLFKRSEIQKMVLKSLMISHDYPLKYRYLFNKMFYIYSKKSSIASYRRSCMINNWGRSVVRHFKLSRHFTKKFASDGLLLGLRKASF
jgi:ribosomal protein S14